MNPQILDFLHEFRSVIAFFGFLIFFALVGAVFWASMSTRNDERLDSTNYEPPRDSWGD